MTNRLTVGRRIVLVTLGALLAANGCSDFEPPDVTTTLDSAAVPTASDPLTASTAVVSRVAARFSAPSTSESELTYVSLPPGTVPGGEIATVTNTRLNVAVTTAVQDGGFDPVGIAATVGDELLINAQLSGGLTTTLRLTVPRAARPKVVRADPPPRKRDVPLNTRIVVVFSEPLLAGSETGILLRRAGGRVPVSVTLAPDGLRAEITPSGLLSRNTDYEIVVPTTVRDLSGDALEMAVRSTFTTGTTQIVASVATDPTAVITNPNNGDLRTQTMTAIRQDDGHVSGTFSVFDQATGERAFGRVTCFTIVGSAAWVTGVVEGANDTPVIGRDFAWVLADNPPSSGIPDRLSLAFQYFPDTQLGTAQNFCANTPDPSLYAALTLYNVISGNIVVNGSGPPPPPSRDMSTIAFAVWPDGGIQVIDADGTNAHVLTSVEGEGDFSPAWSPDGTKLAFDRRQVGQFAGDIYVINADGSGLKQLTADGFDDSDPAWSPDGSKIAFGRNGAIYVMNGSDGSGLRALTTGGYDFHPTWSPDGSRIAFASSRSGTNAIYVMAADGTSIRQITSDSFPDYHPWWSPDGQKIAFQRDISGVSVVYLINPDGTGLTKLTLFGRTPSWSPDSRVIVFEQYGLTIVNADGSGMLRLGIGFDPAWSPAGGMPPRPHPFVSLSIAGGDAQTGTVGTILTQPLTVRATRDDGTPVSGVHISWYLPNGGLPGQPNLSTYFRLTDGQGLASVSLTLGSSAPEQIKLRAAITDGTGLTPGVEFTATTVAP